jgi:hypothetical protein
MSLKFDKGKPRHEIALPFRFEKVRKNLASFRDDHDEARMPTGLVLNLSDPPFAVERPSGAIPEEACRDPDPLPKGADRVRGLRRRNLLTPITLKMEVYRCQS